MSFVVGEVLPFHPEYEGRCRCYRFWEVSYKANHKYKHALDCDGMPVFRKHANEPDQNAAERKALTPVIGMCRPVIQIYNNYIFSSTISRDTKNTRFIEWQKNVDLYQTTFHNYLRYVAEQAQTIGEYLVLVDTNKTDPALSEEQSKQAGLQPFCVKIHPSRLINWVSKDGEHYNEMLILFPEVDEARLYVGNTVTVIKYDPDDKKVVSVGQPIVHGFSEIPIVRVACDDDFEPQTGQIAEYQRALYHETGLLCEESAKQVFTSYMICGADLANVCAANNPEPEVEKMFYRDVGNRKFTFVSAAATVNRLSADATQSEQLRSNMQMWLEQIYKAAGIEPEKQTGNVESAQTKRWKFNSVANIARGLADHFQDAERKLIRLWCEATGENVEESEYWGDYTDESLSMELSRVLQLVAAELPGTLKSAVVRNIAPKLAKLNPTESQDIEAEAKALYTKAEATASNLLVGGVVAGAAAGTATANATESSADLIAVEAKGPVEKMADVKVK
jgi:hypothetical protein